ncbi:MAG: glycosyltransferase [Syntrophomonas sp.]
MSNKKKLLFVITNLDTGGIQKALINLLTEIKNRYDVYLYPFSLTGPLCSQIPEGVTVLKSSKLIELWGLSQQQAAELSTARGLLRGLVALYCKFFSNTIPLWLTQLTQRKLSGFDYAIAYRQDTSCHSMYAGCMDFVENRVKAGQKIAYLHYDYVNTIEYDCTHTHEMLNKMDKIVCVSRGSLKSMLTIHPQLADKSFYTYNCYDFEEILQKSTLSKPDFDPDCINLVIAARISEEKGIDRAVRVVSRLAGEGYRLNLHIVGDGVQRKMIENLIRELDVGSCITLHGSQDNPYPYIATADILLISSYHEAAPMVIGEAKVLNTPILTTETGSAIEMIRVGQEGFISQNSEQGIYDSLKMILDNPHLLENCKNHLAGCSFSNQEGLNQFEAMLTAPVLAPAPGRIPGAVESRLNHG